MKEQDSLTPTKKNYKKMILIGIVVIIVVGIIIAIVMWPTKNTVDDPLGIDEPILGGDCGTVSPEGRDECCVNSGQGNKYDTGTAKCITLAQDSKTILTNKECGDGTCDRSEIAETCPQDCISTCGDGIVQDAENIKNCRYDIMVQCGDGVCDEWEHYRYCSEDCEECVVDDSGKYDGPNECPPSPRWV